jgi:hypothetical protein
VLAFPSFQKGKARSKKMANVTEDTTVAPAGASTTDRGTPNSVHPNRRRIIKASHPKGTNGDTYPNGTTNAEEEEEEQVNNHHKKKKQEDDDDDDDDPIEGWRNERLKASEKRGKALREKDLQERRKANVVNEAANAAPNPFSRFLSVFSVEPKFPEHKRSYEGEEDKTDMPSEKRLRPSESCGPEGENGNNGKSGLTFNTLWVAAALAVVVGVALAVHRGRKK